MQAPHGLPETTEVEQMSNWRQVQGVPIWKNLLTGSMIAIHGSTDKAYFVVRKTTPYPSRTGGSTGTVRTIDVSPYFILKTKPVGEVGRAANAAVREYKNWRYGSIQSALSVARSYMLANPGGRRKVKRK